MVWFFLFWVGGKIKYEARIRKHEVRIRKYEVRIRKYEVRIRKYEARKGSMRQEGSKKKQIDATSV